MLQNLWQNGDENEWKNKAELHAKIEAKLLFLGEMSKKNQTVKRLKIS